MTNWQQDKKVSSFVARLLSPLGKEGWGDDLIQAALEGYQLTHAGTESAFQLTFTQGQEHTYVHVVYHAIPFLNDSLVMCLREKGYHSLLTFGIEAGAPDQNAYLLIQIDQPLTDTEKNAMGDWLHSVSADVQSAVQDWQPMRQVLKEAEDTLGDADRDHLYTPFLDWMHIGFFTFLGYRFFGCDGAHCPEKDLGMTKNYQDRSFFGMDRETEKKILEDSRDTAVLQVTKTMVQATVHRPVPMDVIRVHAYAGGEQVGEHQFFGLFTAGAYNTPISETPYIRHKLDALLKAVGVDRESHEGRHLVYALNTVPKDILFQTDVPALENLVQGIMGLRHRHKLNLFAMPDCLGHFVSCLVYVPRDRYTPQLALEMGAALSACYKGALVSHEVQIGGDLTFARVHYIISTDAHPEHRIVCDIKSTEVMLEELSMPWILKFKTLARIPQTDEEEAAFFPPLYQKHYAPEEGVVDYPFMKRALECGSKTLRIFTTQEGDREEIHIKIFSPQMSVPLADTFPILENMGLRVHSEKSIQLGEAATSVWLHHFVSVRQIPSSLPFDHVQENFQNVVARVFDGALENDRFNSLALAGNASERHILLMRTYYAYMRQIGWPHTRATVVPVLEKYPLVLKNIKDLFYARFDPASTVDEIHLLKETEHLLSAIESAEEEMIFARMIELIQATDRTNYFQKTKEGADKPYISLKVLPAQVRLMEGHKGMYEIFVYAPHVEGIHLRSGEVSRGGLRWSDRRSDYRREVMDLMRAQFVKNAVIVPMGAKGGFYVKKDLTTLSFEARYQVGIEAYKTFIAGLLDVVDNREGGVAVPPADTVVKGQDDSYLVVAADKGTATFSDTANQVSESRHFWLGDAFASGGSSGYDHKKMGITSRGAWESVKRHFFEMEKSMDTPFSVVGVGDMSGDVFGNGMLLSPHIHLIAAFNHAHIFIDPHPDAETSFQERKRLFEQPRTGWNDYNPNLISKGGGVYERKAKSITLSKEARDRLGLSTETWAPNDLIREILKQEVDLLWFGGIGTYVKDETESHGEVGDHANDVLRINGDQVRARVIGEGANLGLTQKGRVACARAGVRLNRDSVDNAAGVHCSDYEVNIKILFQDIMKKKKLSREDRDICLKEMTEEVSTLVLRSNAKQALAISLEMRDAEKNLTAHAIVIRFFESASFMKRTDEQLPSDDLFEQMSVKGMGLTRPEIAVLISYMKLYLKEKFLTFPLKSIQNWEGILLSYFPARLAASYKDFILQHPLSKEIVVTELVNAIVNQLGVVRTYALFLNGGQDLRQALSAYQAICAQVPFESFFEGAEQTEIDVQYDLLQFLQHMIEKSVQEIKTSGRETGESERNYLSDLYEELKNIRSEKQSRIKGFFEKNFKKI